jgi:hypothetical protein
LPAEDVDVLMNARPEEETGDKGPHRQRGETGVGRGPGAHRHDECAAQKQHCKGDDGAARGDALAQVGAAALTTKDMTRRSETLANRSLLDRAWVGLLMLRDLSYYAEFAVVDGVHFKLVTLAD